MTELRKKRAHTDLLEPLRLIPPPSSSPPPAAEPEEQEPPKPQHLPLHRRRLQLPLDGRTRVLAALALAVLLLLLMRVLRLSFRWPLHAGAQELRAPSPSQQPVGRFWETSAYRW